MRRARGVSSSRRVPTIALSVAADSIDRPLRLCYDIIVNDGALMRSNLQTVSPPAAIPEPERMVDKARRAADFLKALGHENRLMILCILSQGEKSVSELEAMLSLRQPTVSQQLARLRAEGLVATRRDGKAIHYSLASEEARVVVGAVYDMFCSK
jgi:DNA-binding transcriptional ArsR family regulator